MKIKVENRCIRLSDDFILNVYANSAITVLEPHPNSDQ